MKLPPIDEPHRFQGLYVFDFGTWTSVGYTAAEIAILLEDPTYRDGKVYKIHRAYPDGRMELRGISSDRFELESGMFFYRADVDLARADFRRICDDADRAGPPCRAYVHLSDRGPQCGPGRFVTAILFPSEFEDEFGRWLTSVDYAGGDTAEGGISLATGYLSESKEILARRQLWGSDAIQCRPADQVIAESRKPVQRFA